MENVLTELKDIINKGKLESYTFNLKDLPNYNDYKLDIRKHKEFTKIFSSLNEKTNDCLYWFSTDNEKDTNFLKKEIEVYREALKNRKDIRVVPAKNTNLNSSVIYVGVRKGGARNFTRINNKRVEDRLTHIEGRIIQHLGYYKKGTTQGVQFVHWAKDCNIKVTLNVIEFQESTNQFLYIIEKLHAIKLKPILGKH